MRHKVKKNKLKIGDSYKKAVLRNLAMAVIIYEKVKTTRAKAKMVQPLIEKIITIGKTKDKIHAIRKLEKVLQHENSAKKILEVLVDKYKDKKSGFTRITKLGFRNGDNAPLVQIELI